MKYRYRICDVFTTTRFGGNPLAVFPDARGLSDNEMENLAREFNFSESTFVFPTDDPFVWNVRIFTPTKEVPFAGHPNIGTAFVLASEGAFGSINNEVTVQFEEKAGVVPVTVRNERNSRLSCELLAPETLSVGNAVPADTVAEAVSLDATDIITTTHPPHVASVGLPFLIAEIIDRAALQRAHPRVDRLEALQASGIVPDIHLYTRSNDEYDIRARMFAPLDNIIEDPATGSANCALVALLNRFDDSLEMPNRWRIAQGVEMGRPSELELTVTGNNEVRLKGHCVMVAEGFVELD